MSCLAVLCALAFLMFVAYRGASVILFAPIAALLAVSFSDPTLVMPVFSGIFAVKMGEFVQRYFPLFLLGAAFGKMIEIAGFSKAIAKTLIKIAGPSHAMLAILLVCNVLTYGGVSLFVVVFAAYPFAAAAFRAGNIPKRFIPGTIALGALSYTMDALPGTPQIQNLIPAPFFGTDAYAAPWLGVCGAVLIFAGGTIWLKRRIAAAQKNGEGYGDNHRNEPDAALDSANEPSALIALLPLILVGVLNKMLTVKIPDWYGSSFVLSLPGLAKPLTLNITELHAGWALLISLAAGILATAGLAPKAVAARFSSGMQDAVRGSLLAIMNTSSEYGFGAVIASLPGFLAIKGALHAIPTPLLNEAVSVSTLAGVTGSASGGLSIALAALAPQFKAAGEAAHIPAEVLHRIASMASGGMDSLPHNGAVITILAVTGLTHREAYADIFAITLIKTLTVLLVIGIYYATGLV